jgi:MFS family permease
MRLTGIFSSRINWKQFAPAFVIVLNTFIWYTLTYSVLSNIIDDLIVSGAISGEEKMMLFAMYFVGTASSAILGATFLRHKRETYLFLWMLAGTLMTALLITIPGNSTVINGLISLFLGVSLGIGFPSCLAYFADATAVETRGTCGGITWGVVGIGTLILALLVGSFDLSLIVVTLVVWRALGVVAFFLMTRGSRKVQQPNSQVTYNSILRRRDVMQYLLPWIMLSLVNFTEAPILDYLFGDLIILVTFVEFALIGLFALVGGILADLVGRKRVIITGFVMLGIGYAVLSFFSELPFFQYLYTACDGIAWGMFSSVFLITLWGDLAQNGKEKYYVLGGLPFLLAGFLSIAIKPYVELIGTVASFSLASFFLFLAVLPLIYAPETLPEKKIKERELKSYLEKAKKAKEKYS